MYKGGQNLVLFTEEGEFFIWQQIIQAVFVVK